MGGNELREGPVGERHQERTRPLTTSECKIRVLANDNMGSLQIHSKTESESVSLSSLLEATSSG